MVPDPSQRAEPSAYPWTLPLIGVGGMAGASARYALEEAWPHADGGVPWATLLTNVSGCLLIGVLMVVVTEAGPRHPLWRPVIGVGVLGGYTTLSTYAVQVQHALQGGAPVLAFGYLLGTVAAALAAVTIGTLGARAVVAATVGWRQVDG